MRIKIKNILLTIQSALIITSTHHVEAANVSVDHVPKWINLVGNCSNIEKPVIQEFLTVLADARTLASGVAEPKKLYVNPCSDNTHFDTITNTIEFRTEWLSPNSLRDSIKTHKPTEAITPMEAKYAYGVMIHEYGHAVLETGFENNPNYPAWRQYLKEIETAVEAATDLQNKIKDTEKNLPLDLNGWVDWESIRNTHKDLNEAYKLVEKTSAMMNIMVSYSELFADSLAVINSGDPKIIFEAIDDIGAPERDQVVYKFRDFSELPSKEALSKWSNDVISWSDHSDGLMPYELLGPARYELWKNIRHELKSPSVDKRKLVKEVFDSIAGNFQNNFSNDGKLDHFNPKELNLSLSKSFECLKATN